MAKCDASKRPSKSGPKVAVLNAVVPASLLMARIDIVTSLVLLLANVDTNGAANKRRWSSFRASTEASGE